PVLTPYLLDGAFHHVAASVCRSDRRRGIRLYVDGRVVAAFDPSDQPGDLTCGQPLLIGGYATPGYPGAFHGALDEVDVFNRALTALEVHALFAAGPDGKCPPGEHPRPPADGVVAREISAPEVYVFRGGFKYHVPNPQELDRVAGVPNEVRLYGSGALNEFAERPWSDY